jgi:hypothetical protein
MRTEHNRAKRVKPPKTERIFHDPRSRAGTFLRRTLAQGPVLANEIMQRSRAAGIKVRTLNRAKRELGIQSRRIGNVWVWLLTPSLPPG